MSRLILILILFILPQFSFLEEGFACIHKEDCGRTSSPKESTADTNSCTQAKDCCEDITACQDMPTEGFKSFLINNSPNFLARAGIGLGAAALLDAQKACLINTALSSTSLFTSYTHLKACDQAIEKADTETGNYTVDPKTPSCVTDLPAAKIAKKKIFMNTLLLGAEVVGSGACAKLLSDKEKKKDRKKDKKKAALAQTQRGRNHNGVSKNPIPVTYTTQTKTDTPGGADKLGANAFKNTFKSYTADQEGNEKGAADNNGGAEKASASGGLPDVEEAEEPQGKSDVGLNTNLNKGTYGGGGGGSGPGYSGTTPPTSYRSRKSASLWDRLFGKKKKRKPASTLSASVAKGRSFVRRPHDDMFSTTSKIIQKACTRQALYNCYQK